MKPRESQPEFLRIWGELADPMTGKPVVFEAMLCLRHRREIASRFPGARGTGQRGESCDLCAGRRPRTLASLSPVHEAKGRSLARLPSSSYLGPRTSEADTARLLSAPGRAISPGLSPADGAQGSCSRWAARGNPDGME